jgi:MGT family glycosyltransferase
MLFSSVAGLGSLHPLIALAREAKAAGHEVAVATSEMQGAMIERLGFPFFNAGANPRLEMQRRYPDVPVPPIDDETRKQVRQLMFADICVETMLPGLLEACRSWRPHVIVRCHLALAPVIAAEELDIPYATIEEASSGELATDELMFAEPLERWREERGLAPDPELASLRRYLWLVPFPPSLRHDGAPFGPTARRLKPLVFNESHQSPTSDWFAAIPPGKVVHVSLGTAARRPELLSIIVEGLADQAFTVVVATGTQAIAEALGTLPRNVIAVPFVAHSLLLPRCAAFITHAGAGSLITGITAGLPMVFVPLFGDQPANAERAAAAGAGIVLDTANLSVQSVRGATLAILEDSRYRDSVRRIQGEINSLPDHDQAIRWIAQVAEQRSIGQQ